MFVDCIVYKATVSKINQTSIYFGSAEDDFKTRYKNHILSFHSKGYKHRTELSKYVWSLTNVRHGCDFSLAEKEATAPFEGVALLNKRSSVLIYVSTKK